MVLVVGIVGECETVFAQGMGEQKRSVGIITPGSLYKSRTFTPPTLGPSNNANPAANRGSSMTPQSTAAQPLSKPMTLGTVQQPSMVGTMTKTMGSQTSSFTPSYTPGQSAPLASQQSPFYTMGQQSMAQRSTFSSTPLGTTFSTPMPQPSYLMSPQFTPAPSPFLGGQPNTSATLPTKPIYTMDSFVNTSQSSSPANNSMTGLQRTPPLQLSPMSLSPSGPSAPLMSPLTTPLSTPLAKPQQQPLSTPESPYLQPKPSQR